MLFKSAASWGIVLGLVSPSGGAGSDLAGVWEAHTYRLKSGQEHAVRGLIFFSEENWTVLFFVLDGAGDPARASAEGGTYRALDGRLEFAHRYHFSKGGALPGLEESPLRMELREAAQAAQEPCGYQIESDRLTISFPSGNAMEFRRGR